METAPRVAALMARELGWDAERTDREVEHYAARVDAERESQRMPDDRTADAARLGAPDVRAGVAGGSPEGRLVQEGRAASAGGS